MKVAVIGGGAAGCFCAVNLKRMAPETEITVLESGRKTLAKVAVTGGGRCNLTNTFKHVPSLSEVYPRGARLMERLLRTFGWQDTVRWFGNEGVPTVAQEDECIFPASQDAMQIVRTLQRLMDTLGVTVRTGFRAASLSSGEDGFLIRSAGGEIRKADAVVVTTGGGRTPFLEGLGLETVPPVPSLFTFSIDEPALKALMGLVVGDTSVSIPGTKLKAQGTLLVTDWGMSGPAILKLSSHAARYLQENEYKAPLAVNWLGGYGPDGIREILGCLRGEHPRKLLSTVPPEGLPGRLWQYLLRKNGLREDMTWNELGSKGFNRLAEGLFQDPYRIAGKCPFKEEFVTCGGVSLHETDPRTLESRSVPGLYFAGEVLDIDAVTGGFNLQVAWTTGYVVARSLSEKREKP